MSLWIARTECIIGEDIPAPPSEVRDFYVDLGNIKDFHPLVVSVEMLSHDQHADGYQTTYRVRDRIPLGPLTIGITYWARVQVPTGGNVLTEARQFPRVRLNGVVSFEPTEKGTRLTERLTIAAPRLLAATTAREAVDAHVAMLAGIRSHFESR
ncbi:SRPBCC family protein [Candidatus Mycobacterium wuenschmannii]|uniref:SRPBCC family protein n=1 Tax=Candidatus Mycobacterium wuenschmannii TaxID=3027808 RepID=A0ABY8VXK3_9MYCO|nr:SRPBCC family protein [Candidatus Mycobacterium wuenschmannii]WIM86873.1 SRPBCC family protein [Candidatus Mycobacterium wuenschmannii]